MLNGRLRTLFSAMTLSICLSAALPAQAFAQAVRVTIPFAFEARNSAMPAGDYYLEYRQAGSSLVITAPTGLRQAILTLPLGNPNGPKSPRLVFERMGSHYRLAEVWVGGATTGAGIPATKNQLLVAKGATPERVEIALARK